MYEILTLPNGVRIAYEHLPGVRSAAVGIWVGVGSRCERRGEEGSAHFIEHMLFKGTRFSDARTLARRMDAIGGQVNAFTTRDSTCFYARVLDEHLPEASSILTEMFFDSLFDEEDVKSERCVVLDEIDMYNDTPEDQVVERLLARCFPGPLGKPVLGSARSLEKMTGESLRSFMGREYTPDRIVVSLCGSFTDKDAGFLAERFSAMTPSVSQPWKTSAYAPSVYFRRKATEQNHLCLGWPGLPELDEKRYAWRLLSNILGGGMSSRLFQTIREQHSLCYSINSFTASYADAGMLGVETAVSPESEETAIRLILEEIEKLCRDGVTEEELRCAGSMAKSSIILSAESTSSRMNRLGASVLQEGRCLSTDELVALYEKVTSDDITELARETLTRDVSFSAVGRLRDKEKYLTDLHLM